MNPMKFKTLAVLMLLLTPGLCFSGMYKYKDEHGNWVYSQQPPASGEYKTLRGPKETRSSVLTKDARDAKLKKARKAVLGDPKENAKKTKIAKETAKNAAKREDLCRQSKKSLGELQIYRRFKDKNGNVTRMDDNVRATKIKKTKTNIQQFCY